MKARDSVYRSRNKQTSRSGRSSRTKQKSKTRYDKRKNKTSPGHRQVTKKHGRRKNVKNKPKIVSHKGKGSLKSRLVVWRLRLVKNKILYIGYRLYPLYILVMGILLGLLIPPLLWSVAVPVNVDLILAVLVIVFLIFLYYTIIWLRWRIAVKKRQANLKKAYLKKNSPRSRRGSGPVRRVVKN